MKIWFNLFLLLLSIFIGFQEISITHATVFMDYHADIASIDCPEKVDPGESFTIEIVIDHWVVGDIEGLLVCIQDQDEYQDPIPVNAPKPEVSELREFKPKGPDTDIFQLEYRATSHKEKLLLVVEVYFIHQFTRTPGSDRPISHLEIGDSKIIGIGIMLPIQTITSTPTAAPVPASTLAPSPTLISTSINTSNQSKETKINEVITLSMIPLLSSSVNLIHPLALILMTMFFMFAAVIPKYEAKKTQCIV
ncbi:MAG: hypothetical protein NWF08_06895 [Candidatus Bathyarchaeota archaeon]|nr:hypothetical protein [Candidatus Bathyarchaeota archaeon]